MEDEVIDINKELTIFHPTYIWKKKTFRDFKIKELLKPLFINGKCLYKKKNVMEIKDYAKSELNTLWSQYKRLNCPEKYKVDLSQKLWDLKNQMINNKRQK